MFYSFIYDIDDKYPECFEDLGSVFISHPECFGKLGFSSIVVRWSCVINFNIYAETLRITDRAKLEKTTETIASL